MAAARNRRAANDGASNLCLLCSSGSLRVALVVLRRCAGRHPRECKHNGRNKYECFHASALHELWWIVPKPLLTASDQHFALGHSGIIDAALTSQGNRYRMAFGFFRITALHVLG